MKKFVPALILFIVVALIAASFAMANKSSAAAAANDPAITAFTSPITKVNREALRNRTARIPVSWDTVNRPMAANLVFEQVMPNGETINVELPRIIPWVASKGDGMAAPIFPGDGIGKITLRVQLVNLFDRKILSERKIDIEIADDGQPGPDVGGNMPTLTKFSSCCAQVRADQLANRSARVPVTWDTKNRLPTQNLVFEQVMEDGTVYNVELPRSNPWVASKGDGVAAPYPPQNASAEALTLRVRLVDLITGRVYDQRTLRVEIGEHSAQEPFIRFFTTTAKEVNLSDLAGGMARIPVSWAAENRPNDANLVFEQVVDGKTVNVELPRSNPWVASSGDGVVAPKLPQTAATILIQVRLVSLRDGSTLHKREFTLPIKGREQTYEVVEAKDCYTAPFPADNGIKVGAQGRVSNQSPFSGLSVYDKAVNGQVIATLTVDNVFDVLEGPYCYKLKGLENSADLQIAFRMWRVKLSNKQEGWLAEYYTGFGGLRLNIVPHAPTVTQINITALNAVQDAGRLKVDWATENATITQLLVVWRPGLEGEQVVDLNHAGSGSITLDIPLPVINGTVVTVTLNASSTLPNVLGKQQNVNVTLTCPPETTPDGSSVCVPGAAPTDEPQPSPTEEPMPTEEPQPEVSFGALHITPSEYADGWSKVAAGGQVVVSLDGASLPSAIQVDFYLTPTGTGTADAAMLIGSDTNPADGVGALWAVPGGGFSAHLSAVVTFADGRTQDVGQLVNVYAE